MLAALIRTVRGYVPGSGSLCETGNTGSGQPIRKVPDTGKRWPGTGKVLDGHRGQEMRLLEHSVICPQSM